ncbi:MAG: TIGR01777 family protein [Bacteroidetes bacterium]|nr:TIGR01777 family protein [Bacteroidota bacterium]
MSQTVLITGGTGLIGIRLTELLLEKGYEVCYLSRHKPDNPKIPTYLWSVKDQYIENDALSNTDHIIHLAGASIAENRWNKKRKKEIYDSRILSSNLLYEKLKTISNKVKAVISASAIGYYGNTDEQLVTEEAPAANDFLGNLCRDWENAIHQVEGLNIRVVVLRIAGMALTRKGGGLPKMAQPIKYFIGAPLGSGRQYLSWIHLDDLCKMFIRALENDEIKGIYNAVAPESVTNAQLTKAIAKKLHRPLLLPNIPKFVLKIILGEMGGILTGGSKISSAKIREKGFQFQYPKLREALSSIFGD